MPTEIDQAMIALFEAKIRLAQAERRTDDVADLVRQLVKTHEGLVECQEDTLALGWIHAAEAARAERDLLETRIKYNVPSPKPEETARRLAIRNLRHIGLAYHRFLSDKRRAPASAAELQPFLATSPSAWTRLDKGEVVFIFNVALDDMSQGPGNTVVAYERQTPSAGGLVLLGEGTAKHVSAAAFKALSLAAPRKAP